MDSFIEKYIVTDNKKVTLKNFSTDFTDNLKKDQSVDLLRQYKLEMVDLQEKLYANNKHSVLIIFQAMDAAGKDSAISHVMSGLNPQGCQVFSFKQPSTEEYDHEFLWRHYKALPEKGRIGIHNRSHYESVLICKVHPELVMNEHLTHYPTTKSLDKKFWNNRYKSIADFEKHLAANGTIIIKFFLHVSKDVQKERFLERIDNPMKNWKFSSSDLQERKRWNDYMAAYEQAISKTSAKHAPWFIVPADKKWFTRIVVCRVIVETLRSIDLKQPKLSEEEENDLHKNKKQLINE